MIASPAVVPVASDVPYSASPQFSVPGVANPPTAIGTIDSAPSPGDPAFPSPLPASAPGSIPAPAPILTAGPVAGFSPAIPTVPVAVAPPVMGTQPVPAPVSYAPPVTAAPGMFPPAGTVPTIAATPFSPGVQAPAYVPALASMPAQSDVAQAGAPSAVVFPGFGPSAGVEFPQMAGPLPAFMAPAHPGPAELNFAQSLPEPPARVALKPRKTLNKQQQMYVYGGIAAIVVTSMVIFLMGDPLRGGMRRKPLKPSTDSSSARQPKVPEESVENIFDRIKSASKKDGK